MKVETDFPPGDGTGILLDECLDFFFGRVVIKTGVVRMRTYRGIDTVVVVCQFDCTLKCAAVRITRANVENCGNAGSLRGMIESAATLGL